MNHSIFGNYGKEKAKEIIKDLSENPQKSVEYAKKIPELSFELFPSEWVKILSIILENEDGKNEILKEFNNHIKNDKIGYLNIYYEKCIDYEDIRKAIFTEEGIEIFCKAMEKNPRLKNIYDKLITSNEAKNFFIENTEFCFNSVFFIPNLGMIFRQLLESDDGKVLVNRYLKRFENMGLYDSYHVFEEFFRFLQHIKDLTNKNTSFEEYENITGMLQKYGIFIEMINQITSKEFWDMEITNTWYCFRYIFSNERTFKELSLILNELYEKSKNIQYVGSGFFARVFRLGDKVLKLRYDRFNLNSNWKIDYHPKKMMMPDFRKEYEDGIVAEVFDFADIDIPENITTILDKELSDDGYKNNDSKSENIGRLLKDNKLPSWLRKYPGVDLSILGLNVNPKKWTKEDLENGRKAGDYVITDIDSIEEDEPDK